ncbi:hypothetical protein EST38_g6006 [Candolleomyces aberdarensis]|uniref:F-box domain-containing protein n=1 Tax=Candolleomyces aberdarensis TaxID=2316362 RepID=A0A4Q2DLR1_9AGAR|nr:hypothetical protein EST38_g6006 [Candolleomyces aberdarensis]
MDPNRKLDAQAVRGQVDQRIADLESEIRTLKTHRNTVVAATSPLPPEILSDIFIILRRVMSDECSYKPSWTRVNHVCRHWRAVALDCPALWSDLMFVCCSPAFTEMMLQRSKNAPLTVKYDRYAPSFDDILCKIASQTSRLRDVELRGRGLDLPKVLSSFQGTAPTLEKLVLQGAELYNRTGSNTYYTIPANFLQDGAPSLQHLDITQFAIHWDALPLSTTLTHLRLENVVWENRPTRKSFSETLAKLLQLETMKLSACLPRSGDASQPDSPPVILPSLRTLELQDLAAELHEFFSMTRIPQEARVNIELHDMESESVGSLFSALRASWTPPKDIVVDAARNLAQSEILDLRVVDYMPRCTPQIMCWFNIHDLPPNFDAENPPANLIVSAPDAIAFGINLLLKAIAVRLGISSLRSLKIASRHVFLMEDMLPLVKDLTKLDKIALWKSPDAIIQFTEVLQKQKDHALAFPSLRSIELHGIDIDEGLSSYADTAIRRFATALKSWMKCHRTIERFAITKCINFVEGHWKVLQAAIPKQVEMYWDEDVYIVEPSEDEGDYGSWGHTY